MCLRRDAEQAIKQKYGKNRIAYKIYKIRYNRKKLCSPIQFNTQEFNVGDEYVSKNKDYPIHSFCTLQGAKRHLAYKSFLGMSTFYICRVKISDVAYYGRQYGQDCVTSHKIKILAKLFSRTEYTKLEKVK